MAGSLVQPVVLPARYGKGAQFCRPDKTCAVSRVPVSNLQLQSSSLRFSRTRVLRNFFLGTESTLRGQVMRADYKPTRIQDVFLSILCMYEGFSGKAIKVILLAQDEARRLGHNFVGTEQILLVLPLIGEDNNIAAEMIKSMGINLKDARVEIIGRGSGFVAIDVPYTPRAKRVLELARKEALQLGLDYLEPEHLLLGLLAEGEGVASHVLEIFGVYPREMHTRLRKVLREFGESTEALEAGVLDGSTVAKDERDKTDLHVQLLEMLENSRMVAAQLEAQNKNLQLDRDERKEQMNSLVGVLNRIADSLGNIE